MQPPKGSTSSTYQRLRKLEELLTSVTNGEANAESVMQVLNDNKSVSESHKKRKFNHDSAPSAYEGSPPAALGGPAINVDYLGSASLGSNFSSHSSSSHYSPGKDDGTSSDSGSSGAAGTVDGSGGFSNPLVDPIAALINGEDVVETAAEFNAEILGSYFTYVNPTLNCIHRETFLRSLSSQPPELVYAMYACAIPHTSLASYSPLSVDYGKLYYEKAQALLNPFVNSRSSLATVQAMLHLVYFAAGSGTPNLSITDRLLGMAITMAKQLRMDSVRALNGPWLEREGKIRTMWCLWMLDTIQPVISRVDDSIWEIGNSGVFPPQIYPPPTSPNTPSFAAIVHATKLIGYISEIVWWFKSPSPNPLAQASLDYNAIWHDLARDALVPGVFVEPNFSTKETAAYPLMMEALALIQMSSPPVGSPAATFFSLTAYTVLSLGAKENREEVQAIVQAVVAILQQSTSSEGVTELGSPIGSYAAFFVTCQAVRFALFDEAKILLSALESYGLARWRASEKLAWELRRSLKEIAGWIDVGDHISEMLEDLEGAERTDNEPTDIYLSMMTNKLRLSMQSLPADFTGTETNAMESCCPIDLVYNGKT
ncbi:hypothetical protein HDU93_008998 [Gonapodya sp. JEL0774]|nr:hypothetical protein HDU93_008998 [Gonapodya sp. JEL0774]